MDEQKIKNQTGLPINNIIATLQDAQGTDYQEEMISGIQKAIDILENKSGIKPSVINQLKAISKNLNYLEMYCMDVDNDTTDTIFYSKLKDMINEKIAEMVNT